MRHFAGEYLCLPEQALWLTTDLREFEYDAMLGDGFLDDLSLNCRMLSRLAEILTRLHGRSLQSFTLNLDTTELVVQDDPEDPPPFSVPDFTGLIALEHLSISVEAIGLAEDARNFVPPNHTMFFDTDTAIWLGSFVRAAKAKKAPLKRIQVELITPRMDLLRDPRGWKPPSWTPGGHNQHLEEELRAYWNGPYPGALFLGLQIELRELGVELSYTPKKKTLRSEWDRAWDGVGWDHLYAVYWP
jgi:hypothetical protein